MRLSESNHHADVLATRSEAVLSELCPRARFITVDDDFRRDRRFRHQAIPLVMPDRG